MKTFSFLLAGFLLMSFSAAAQTSTQTTTDTATATATATTTVTATDTVTTAPTSDTAIPVTTLSESTATGTDKGKKKKVQKEKVKKEQVKKEKPAKAPRPAKTEAPKTTAAAHPLKGKKNLGIEGTGFLEFSSYDRLYMSNVNVNGYRTGGLGMQAFFEYGLTDQITLSADVFYSRLTYANQFKATIRNNFFGGDVLAHYYFLKKVNKLLPFISAGVGLIASSGSALPLLDLGGGGHFFVTNKLSLKGEILFKTAFIHNRFEPALGLAYHF